MTIAAGFRCSDGVVLAADGLYSDGTSSLQGQKIFPIPSNGTYALTIAGSGPVVHIRSSVDEIKRQLAGSTDSKVDNFAAIRSICEEALCRFYSRHINQSPSPVQQYFELQLLIGVWVRGRGTMLYETLGTALAEVDEHRCIGLGAYLARYVTDVLLPRSLRPSVEEVVPLAAYIVGKAKQYVDYCGGSTFIRVLLEDGTDDRIWRDEIEGAERFFDEFFLSLGYLRQILNSFEAEIDMSGHVDLLNKKVRDFKADQRVSRQRRIDLHARSRGPRK